MRLLPKVNRPETPVISVQLPFYAYLFGALILGVILGGVATWMNQGRWRRMAGMRSRDASRWQAEADRLARERDADVTAGRHKQLVTARRA